MTDLGGTYGRIARDAAILGTQHIGGRAYDRAVMAALTALATMPMDAETADLYEVAEAAAVKAAANGQTALALS